jgi:hypothetical protein
MAQMDDRASRHARGKGKARDKKPASPAKAARRPSGKLVRTVGSSGGRAGSTGSGRTGGKRSGPRTRPAAQAAKPAGRARPAPAVGKRRPRSREAEAALETPTSAPALSEEERIESAKYLPAASSPRLFEEERFLFPEGYGVNRVRLHVKDPEWLFAHWDVDAMSLSALREEVGERTLALSRVTLRVVDTGNGGASVILLPPGARSWYVRTAQGRRSYRAELGVTLPSGEFRRLAESNTVVAPRGAPSAERASERRSFRQARAQSAAATAAAARAEAEVEQGSEPWSVPPQDAGTPIATAESRKSKNPIGGASDVFRR